MVRQLGDPRAGFTLIELMIVVAVLALLTTTVSLSANRPRSATASDFARFQVLYDRAREQAVMSRQILGLAVDAEGYQRLRRDGNDWVRIGDAGHWRGAVAVLQPFDAQTPLHFMPGAQATPVKLRFENGEGDVICTSDGWNPVSCAAG